MKRIIAAILTIAMSAMMLAGFSCTAYAEEEAASEETFVFKHGFDLDYPP